MPARPADGPLLDVKRSSHKKMSKLLQAKAAEGWFCVKEDKHTKEMMMTSINRSTVNRQPFTAHQTAAAAEVSGAAASAAAAGLPDCQLSDHSVPIYVFTVVTTASRA